MTVDLSKAKAGDIAVLRCGGEVEIKPAPFDWDTVEWGMAFKTPRLGANKGNLIVYYIGHSLSDDDTVVVQCPDDDRWEYDGFFKEHLTRAPEHDIKEKK